MFCLCMFGCQKVDTKKTTFVTSFYPMYIIAMNIVDGVDDVELVNMAQNHSGCLHDFQLQSDDMKKIESSTAFIINGAGMESFMDKVINELPDVNIINASEGIDLIDNDEHNDHHEEEEEEHEHSDKNPHVWVSVSNYIKQVENVYKGIAEVDPKNADKYKENMFNYVKKLEALKSQMHNEIDNVKNKDIITFHEAFPYFAEEFGLNIAAVISREPESEPSAKEITETIEIVRNTGINALFVEPQYPDTAAKTISAETGAKIYTLDPAVSGELNKDSYINAMENNMKVLKEALN